MFSLIDESPAHSEPIIDGIRLSICTFPITSLKNNSSIIDVFIFLSDETRSNKRSILSESIFKE